jgi:hypothetical protein
LFCRVEENTPICIFNNKNASVHSDAQPSEGPFIQVNSLISQIKTLRLQKIKSQVFKMSTFFLLCHAAFLQILGRGLRDTENQHDYRYVLLNYEGDILEMHHWTISSLYEHHRVHFPKPK